MDGRALGFRDRAFDLVMERASLHHMADWRRALMEMLRVSSGYLLLEEPADDPRSPAKVNAARGQALFLELQREVGYPHFPHIPPADLLRFLGQEAQVREQRLVRADTEIPFAEFFESFPRFAGMSLRESFWSERLERFRLELGAGALCESDRFTLLAARRD
jgi:SAM-dependent methyltransferase